VNAAQQRGIHHPRQTQTLRPPGVLEGGPNLLHSLGWPAVRKGHASDIVYRHIAKKAMGTKGEAVVALTRGDAYHQTAPPSPALTTAIGLQ
jgi:hypothetical protein